MNVAPNSVAILRNIWLLAQAQKISLALTPPSPIYLWCNVVNEPEAARTIFTSISCQEDTVTDFGTGHHFGKRALSSFRDPYRAQWKREVVNTTRINRYTLSLQYMWPAQQILKNGQCTLVEKKL